MSARFYSISVEKAAIRPVVRAAVQHSQKSMYLLHKALFIKDFFPSMRASGDFSGEIYGTFAEISRHFVTFSKLFEPQPPWHFYTSLHFMWLFGCGSVPFVNFNFDKSLVIEFRASQLTNDTSSYQIHQ